MNHFNECIIFEFNPYSYDEKKQEYISQLKAIVEKKYSTGIEKDVCGASFYKDDADNWIFKYKAVPAEAPSSANYGFIHALVLSPISVINQPMNS